MGISKGLSYQFFSKNAKKYSSKSSLRFGNLDSDKFQKIRDLKRFLTKSSGGKDEQEKLTIVYHYMANVSGQFGGCCFGTFYGMRCGLNRVDFSRSTGSWSGRLIKVYSMTVRKI